MAAIAPLLAVTERSPGRHTGRCIDGVVGRVFGGQSMAQALVTAHYAAGRGHGPNSLHAYFVALGSPSTEVEYRSRAVKRGKSIDVIEVVATQGDREILTMLTSFHRLEPSPSWQVPMGAVPHPDALPESDFVPAGTDGDARAPFEFRYAGSPEAFDEWGRIDVWIRCRDPRGLDPAIGHHAALVYAIDLLIARAARAAVPSTGIGSAASLDHAMWFHRPFQIDEWLLVSCTGSTYANSRGLADATVHTADGALVASVRQEALFRVSGNGSA